MMAGLLRTAMGGTFEHPISEADARREWAEAIERGPRFWHGDLETGLVLWIAASDGSPFAPVVIWRPGSEVPVWHNAFFNPAHVDLMSRTVADAA